MTGDGFSFEEGTPTCLMIKPPVNILKKEDVLSLRPQDRDTYAKKIIIEMLELNTKGITVSEIESVSGLNRSTISKHLQQLVAIREAYTETRGKLTIYYRNGTIDKTQENYEPIGDQTFYAFHRVVNEEGNFIYIQEKKRDYHGIIKVKGGIMIKDVDFFSFYQSLQKFALEVSE